MGRGQAGTIGPLARAAAAAGLALLGTGGSAAADGTCWTGETEAGPQARRVVVELPDEGESRAGGALHLYDGEIVSRPLASLDWTPGSAMRFTVRDDAGSVSFEGSPDGDSLAGTITINGAAHPLSISPTVPAGLAFDPAGTWSGTLDVGRATLRLEFEIAPGPCGVHFARAHSPDQGASNLPVSFLELSDAGLRFEQAQLGASYEGTFDDAHGTLTGTFEQGGARFPLVLTRGEPKAASRRARPQDPRPPFPYDAVDVTFPNASAGITLAGTLTLPRGDGPFPAAILVSGSGPQNRDEELFDHRPFLVVADRLTRAGVAVLRYDDRGVGGSGGDSKSATSVDFATDAEAALDFLLAHPRIDRGRVGYVGHSEGGLIAPMVAARRGEVAFVVLWAGPGVPGREIILHQTELLFEASGAGRPLIDAQLAYSERFQEILASEPDDAKALAKIREAIASDLPALTDEQRTAWRFATAMQNREQIDAQLTVLTSPWYRAFLEHDPREDLARTRCPVLGVWGSLDLQVDPAQNLPEVARALARAGNDAHTLVTLPGLNHILQPATTGTIVEYAQIETTVAEEALALMTRWIAETTRRAP